MKYFTSVSDVADVKGLIREALILKSDAHAFSELGKHKTLGMLFFNSSLRTRLSTQKAALNLGMDIMVMNIGSEGWALEFEDGAVMNGNTVEHIKDAAAVIGTYCDVIAVRNFPTLVDKETDYAEQVLRQFIKYCKVPLISMESATLHPLQSLADMMTIAEHKKTDRPKIVLTWAPHVKALPQVVANSFAEWTLASGYDLTITHPKGYELCEDFTRGASIEYDQQKALTDADFVYVKNWSAYQDYGKIIPVDTPWLLDNEKMSVTNNASIMHCLPVRRNVELSDELLDGPNSLVMHQAENRVYAAQSVLKNILEKNF
ncbi:MAG: acetylornithine carbamoyltransferase [Bacteroidota bacterium]|nr:acetylornithine carbamoyltransferase [Bacteroidota bacterium]